MKLLVSILVIVSACFSQEYNWSGLRDSAVITGFSADSFRVTKAFPFTNYENKDLLLMWDDTANAGRASDSMHCEVGYQMGTPFVGFSGSLDTIWSNGIVLDTINSTTASKRYNPSSYGDATNWALNRALEISVRPGGQIDTTLDTASSGALIPILPFWAPLCRFYIKGLSDNAGTAMLCRMYLVQRGWANVRNK